MPSSPDALPDRPLAESIAVATRSSHTRLNKSIIARLPLVTHAHDPSRYITGLLHIVPIYLTFESCWKAILESPSAQDETGRCDCCPAADTVVDHGVTSTTAACSPVQLQEPVVCDRVRSLLQELRLPGLMRSGRLRADIRALTGWPEHIVEEQIQEIGQSGRLGEFTAHIRSSIEQKPHLLIAYSYILYMALFAGGRFIRARLEACENAFWNQTPSLVRPNMLECVSQPADSTERVLQQRDSETPPPSDGDRENSGLPLTFFRFETPEDGEDLKREFKSRLLDAETVLLSQERHEIVQESICIFDYMELLVGQLDEVCAEGDATDLTASMRDLSTLMGGPMTARLRDSVAVTKDRAARSMSRNSSSNSSDGVVDSNLAREKYGSDVTVSILGSSGDGVPGHPVIPASPGALELCPALKSMRFESKLPVPVRAAAQVTEGMKGLKGSQYTTWLLMAAFGAIVIGTIMTTRRNIITA